MTSRLKHKATRLAESMLLPVATLLLGACNGQTVYHSFQSLSDKGWLRQDTLNFEVAVPDSFTTYRLFVEVRNQTDYPYLNLPLSITERDTALQVLSTDTVQLMLATPQGHWTGQGWGGMYQTAFPAGRITLKEAGTYRFQIVYTLPDTLLKGISDVGIRIDHTR